MATMFWLATARMLLRPIPPMPTQAMLSRSLGGVNPRPRTCRGTIVSAAPVAAAVSMNSLRVTPAFFSSMSPPFREGHDIPSGHDSDHRARADRVGASNDRSESWAVEVALRRQEPRRVAHLQDRPGAENVRDAGREGLLGRQGRRAPERRQGRQYRVEGSVRGLRGRDRMEHRRTDPSTRY